MKQFLSCDWGTSSFRLKLVETRSLRTLAELQHTQGIATTYANWQTDPHGKDRFHFFAAVIRSAIGKIEDQTKGSLAGVPVILSGMASSSLGMKQLQYKQIPFSTNGSDLKVEQVSASKEFEQDVFIISGVCSDVDVMRGEETQLVGAVDGVTDKDSIYIFPGTHSKHISVRDGKAYDFKTYMTGEIFSLLSKSSVLTEAVNESTLSDNDTNIEAFVSGVRDTVNSNLLNKLFRVRTHFLLDKMPAGFNRSYLSGLLIGHEVNDLKRRGADSIVVVSSNMSDHYRIALQALEIETQVTVVSDHDVAKRGQHRIISHLL